MLRNIDASYGLVFSHRLLLALVASGVDRGTAYGIVQSHAMYAWDHERDFREIVTADPEITKHVDEAALESVFDLSATVQHVDVVFERLRALTHTGEAVHV